MSDLIEMLKAHTESVSRAYLNGHHAGYQQGFKDGIAEAQRIINMAFPEFKVNVPERVSAS